MENKVIINQQQFINFIRIEQEYEKIIDCAFKSTKLSYDSKELRIDDTDLLLLLKYFHTEAYNDAFNALIEKKKDNEDEVESESVPF